MADRFRYRAVLAYVGTDFHGWQLQRNASRTVQAVLEDALGLFAGEPVRPVAAGRTDRGVHADGQVIHFDLSEPRDPRVVRDGVNSILPWDARLLEVARAPSGFDARRDAVGKEYLYRWSRAEVIAPRDALFVAPLSASADAARMAAVAALLPGRRDFGVFAVRRPEGGSVRTLHSVAIEEEGTEIRARFRGDGFLRGMVRSIAGLLADIARDRLPAAQMAEILASGDRRLLAQKAQASGLTLVKVEYETTLLRRMGSVLKC
ncbi:MAG: tRNA pseudouridine(38-40) synthase TruA [Acidobacteriota bacterium]|nr:tRNA pseudouridine(38-40) synthase TruA [Acidobacteriota bacterium]MDQ5872847.1 tRNA pseudouridine(38-40) synthase TruA [Acidobacteriota bacterium]